MKIRKILEDMSPTQKWLLRKKKVECDSCGEINYEEDLRSVGPGRHEPGYAVCPNCGGEELSDYSGDDKCPNCGERGSIPDDSEPCTNCGWD